MFFKLVKSDIRRYHNDVGWFYLLRVFHPRILPVFLIRLTFSFYQLRIFRPFSHLTSLLNIVLFGIEYTPKCRIGFGLMIPHSNGVVIGASYIGNNVTIFQGVTLGAKFADIGFDINKRPIVCDNVVIGAGAKILGKIHLFEDSTVAANSLVLNDIPSFSLAIGVPSKLISRADI